MRNFRSCESAAVSIVGSCESASLRGYELANMRECGVADLKYYKSCERSVIVYRSIIREMRMHESAELPVVRKCGSFDGVIVGECESARI